MFTYTKQGCRTRLSGFRLCGLAGLCLEIAAAALVVGAASACGGSKSEPTPPVETTVITITASGVSPKNVTVPVGSQVTFTNNDSRVHDMQSDPHPEHNDCPELMQVGFLRVGESRTSGNLNNAQTCTYHDNMNEGTSSLRGSIVIQ
jgi:plastocyanin